MKYAIIIPDGAADEPLPELGGRTPIEAAHTPNMDRVAAEGRQGLVRTVPDGFESGSDVATMTLLGYDPAVYHTGRAPLEAAAQRIPLAPTDWVFRCNLVTTHGGLMKDHSAGGITNVEARQLLVDLAELLREPGFEFYQGVSYRNLLVYRGEQQFDLKTKPPHEIPEEPTERWAPSGTGSEILRRIMDRSADLFARHEINRARRERGVNEATQVWLWGQGHAPNMPTFAERFGVGSGCMITGVDLLRGLAVLLGWAVKEVEGMTSFHDTNYAGQGHATAAALDEYDLVLSHIEAPDEASHQADWKTKVAAIEHIDKHVVGPVLQKMRKFDEWRLLVLPDHPTNIATRKHGYAPSPFAMMGSGVKPAGGKPYSERNAAEGVKLERGHELMEYFCAAAKAEGQMRLEFTYAPEDLDEWAKTRLPWARSGFKRGLVGWLVFIGLAVLLVNLVQHRKPNSSAPPATAPSADPWTDILLPLLPWVVIFGFVWYFIFLQMRRRGRSLWNRSKPLQSPQVLTIDANGVESSNVIAVTRWQWHAFLGWKETANLFILGLAENAVLVIPKRAATPPERVELAETFRVRIAPPTGGFPIQQAGGR